MFLSWILSHKLLSFFILAAIAFGISTLTLGIENANLRQRITALTTNSSTEIDMSRYRLPKTAKPLVYDLYLYPNLTSKLFQGKFFIQLTHKKPTVPSFDTFKTISKQNFAVF